MKRRVCLVSPGHVASNPRLVKEANALHQAGFDVRVVAGDYMAAVRPLDETILATAPWRCVRVGLGTRWEYLGGKLRQRWAQEMAKRRGIRDWLQAMWAHSPQSAKLAAAAIAEPADLYIAHCLAALPAAAIASQHHQARLGFDAEDFHIGELAATPENTLEIRVRDCLERSLLPHCHHFTAASPEIAKSYAERYGVIAEPILNVFPLSEAPRCPKWRQKTDVRTEGFQISPSQENHPANSLYSERWDYVAVNSQQSTVNSQQSTHPKSNPLSLYWFSQTIGAGRGLEAVIQAMGKMQTPVHLYLRGFVAKGYAQQLEALAAEVGVSDRIHLLPPAPPAEMVRCAADYDIGLALELTQPFNRAICLTNKIFTYLLAGLPILMSQTPAQQEFAQHLGQAVRLINLNDPDGIALTLDTWLSNLTQFRTSREIAWKLGRETYNWDHEQMRFLQVVERAFK